MNFSRCIFRPFVLIVSFVVAKILVAKIVQLALKSSVLTFELISKTWIWLLESPNKPLKIRGNAAQ